VPWLLPPPPAKRVTHGAKRRQPDHVAGETRIPGTQVRQIGALFNERGNQMYRHAGPPKYRIAAEDIGMDGDKAARLLPVPKWHGRLPA
jgi:hypothetical protein